MGDELHDGSDTAEEAVRKYLLFLDDPSKLRDSSEIQRRTAAVINATDPIEKLKALAALEQASAVDGTDLRAGFVRHAREWAESNGVSAGAFVELKVEADVLAESGFDVTGLRRLRNAGRSGRRSSTGASSARRSSVSADEIRSAMLAAEEPFTLTEVMDRVGGGSPGTLRKVVDELVSEGQVTKLGPVANHGQRGRAPIQYARA